MSNLRRTPSRSPLAALLAPAAAALLLLLAACGDDGDTETSDTSDTTASTETTVDTTSSETTDTSAGSTSSETTSGSSTSDGAGTTTLPGEPFDGFPQSGDELAVMGVAHDDVLNVREVPGTSGTVLVTAGPLVDDLVATGEARLLTSSIWYEVTYQGKTGWVSSSYVGFKGGTDDATSDFLAGRPPIEAETMVELADLVAEGYASEDPPSRVVQSVAPTVGDLGEITYDIIGIGDDSVAGYRLHIFGQLTEGGEGFSLKSIERTWFCLRGLSGEICV